MEYFCFYCGISLDLNPLTSLTSPNGYTRDHMDPVSRGGSNFLGNLVDCCRRCNLRKGRRTVEEYREKILAEDPVGRLVVGLRELQHLAIVSDFSAGLEGRHENNREHIRACEVLLNFPDIVFYGERVAVAMAESGVIGNA